MFKNQSAPDSESGDLWRRQLINRLADVQVALWASDQGTPATAKPERPLGAAATHHPDMTAGPETVFLGLSVEGQWQGGTGQGPAATPAVSSYAAWDRIDEKRQILDLVHKFSNESTARARRSTLTFGLFGLLLSGLLGTFGLIVLTGAPWNDTASVVATPDKASIAAVAWVGPSKAANAVADAESLPTPHIEVPQVNRTSRNPAADNIASLLSAAPASSLQDESIRQFADTKDQPALSSYIQLDVSDSGHAAFPFRMHAGHPSMGDAIILIADLPLGVVPAIGSYLDAGFWSFKLSDLAQQKIQISDSAHSQFDVSYGVIQPTGELAGRGRAHIELRRRTRPRLTVTENASEAGKTVADAATVENIKPPEIHTQIDPKIVTEPSPHDRSTTNARPRKAKAVMPRPTPAPEKLMALGVGEKEVRTPPRIKPRATNEAKPAASGWNLQPQAQPSWSPFLRE